MHRYLRGTIADDVSEHIIVQEEKGKRFAWCKPDAISPRITGLIADKNHVTCQACRKGSLMWLIEKKRNAG